MVASGNLHNYTVFELACIIEKTFALICNISMLGLLESFASLNKFEYRPILRQHIGLNDFVLSFICCY